MPVQINILRGGTGIEFASTGVVTGKDIIAANEKIYTREQLLRLKYKIIDRSSCTKYLVSSAELNIIASQDIQASRINGNIIVVIVAPTDLQFGMTRMWQVLTEKTGWHVEIFRDRESAYAYIKDKFPESISDSLQTE